MTRMIPSRRDFLRACLAVGASAGAAQAQSALAPGRSLIPAQRPDDLYLRAIPTGPELIARSRLTGVTGYVVADARTGTVLEAVNPDLAMPPASTAKALTTAYALDRLGAAHRFRTRLMADGPIRDGTLEGDLWLVGGGDPLLDTDTLAEMVATLRAVGVDAVTGRLRIDHTALPWIYQIDPGQPVQVGYNPALSGLNLNFNRVHFQWTREGDDYTVTMDARSGTHIPPVTMARMQVAQRTTPVYTFSDADGVERWTVARGALGGGGTRWLPVRRPHLYAAQAFAALALQSGLLLQLGDTGTVPEAATELVVHESDPLPEVLRGMMRYSTNLTAEVTGMAATVADGHYPATLLASARQMNNWSRNALDIPRPRLTDHSGLGPDSRIAAADMVHGLIAAGPEGRLRELMRDLPVRDEEYDVLPDHPAQVQAKTGTLNFVSALAGYVSDASTGNDYAFAIFSADLERRARLSRAERERPDGGGVFNARAKRLQQNLIRRWTAVYAQPQALIQG